MRTLNPYYTYSPTTSNTWQTVDISSQLNTDEIAVWILISGYPSSGSQNRGAKHPSHTGTWYASATSLSRTWSILRFLNSSQEISFYGKSGTDQTVFTIVAAFTVNDLTTYNGHPTEYTFSHSATGSIECDQWDLTARLPGGSTPTHAFINYEDNEDGLYQERAVSYDTTTGCANKFSFMHPQTMIMGIDGNDDGSVYISGDGE